MSPLKSLSMLRWLLCPLSFALLATAGPARADDLEDLFENLITPLESFGVTTAWDCNVNGLCPGTIDNVTFPAIDTSPLQSVTTSIVNDRIVPLSSSVSGFTYEYNEDLDVYDRSTKTFGPLFSERAQTIGKRRFLVGLSQSYLEFDEFDGNDLGSTSLSELSDDTLSASGGSIGNVLLANQLSGSDEDQILDADLDIEIKQAVSTMYFTYGLTDRIDVGLVVPLIHLDVEGKASARAVSGEDALPPCSDFAGDPFSTELCATEAGQSSTKESDSKFGVGDLVLRGKWNFLNGPASGAFLLQATLPTGDEDNLMGLDDPTFTPGVVMSRDFETPIGGLGLQGFVGYNIRPDDSDEQQITWAAGAALQPFGRASMNIDLLGGNETAGEHNFTLDLSAGVKFMIFQNVLLDFNYIVPLNDDGLRPSSGIFTGQIEAVFGD